MGICPQQFISPQRFDSADAGAAVRCGTQPLDCCGNVAGHEHRQNAGPHGIAGGTERGTAGLANGILIEDVGRLSHEYSTALRILEFLQDHAAVLICTQADVRYELYIKGLSQPLQQRAMSKGGIVPW